MLKTKYYLCEKYRNEKYRDVKNPFKSHKKSSLQT